MLQLEDFTTALVTYHNNDTIVIFKGLRARAANEDTVSEIAWLHGFDTVVYEYTQQDELIIVLLQQQQSAMVVKK
jgi:hypothetical protein